MYLYDIVIAPVDLLANTIMETVFQGKKYEHLKDYYKEKKILFQFRLTNLLTVALLDIYVEDGLLMPVYQSSEESELSLLRSSIQRIFDDTLRIRSIIMF